MKAKDVSNLYWFCQSVESGSFAAASLRTKVSAPTLSRALSALEEKVGEKLVHRNAKQFQLTTAGEEFYQRFTTVFKQLDEEWVQLSNSQPVLTGDIHISCPEPFADFFLQDIAVEFMKLHPEVNVHVHFASDTDRFIENKIDLAIVIAPPTISNLIQKPLFKTELALAASPSYLQEHGRPEWISDLLEHHLLAGNTTPYWELIQHGQTVKVPVKPRYSVDSLRLSIRAARAGLGICLLPKNALSAFVEQGELEVVLPDADISSNSPYLLWADRKLMAARVVAFREMIFERMTQPLDFLEAVTEAKFVDV